MTNSPRNNYKAGKSDKNIHSMGRCCTGHCRVVAALATMAIGRRLLRTRRNAVRIAAAYGIGTVAAFWSIERIAGFW